jgi:3-phenylpropionate/trans-cinnamate dioxygenase ferredoxin reductase subunit
MGTRIVIVGTGQAGVQTALSLRDEGFQGDIVMVGEEPGWPYQRPPLSKAYMLGKMDDDGILLKSPSLYADYRIDFRAGLRALAIDRVQRRVTLSDGASLDYDHLVLATGARQKLLSCPGADLEGVLPLRTLADAQAIMARLARVRRAVVVGGGFIGMEFAAVARAQGLDVTVIEIAVRPMARVLSQDMADFFRARHQAWGVDFRFGVGVAAIRGEGHVSAVELTDGQTIEADLVLVGIGVIPNAELAEAAGLEVTDGIVVDEKLATSDPAIHAVGDVAQHPNRFSDIGPTRIESVQNAIDQGRVLAARLAGKPKPYDAVPWFWSDQGDLKLQIAGLANGYDRAVRRGDPAEGAFSVFLFSGERLLAVESVNKGADHIMARRLLTARTGLTPTQAADLSTPLKAHMA